MTRVKSTTTEHRAGCLVCTGTAAIWTGKNALAVAARHHDATGHATWADQILQVRYGSADTSHPDLFEAAA